jgi:hypothetical protein
MLDNVRASGLNFCFNKTPFSIYLTLRKSFIKSQNIPALVSLEKKVEASQTKYDNLLSSHENLEKAYLSVKNDFADVLDDCNDKANVIEGLKTSCEEKNDRITHLKHLKKKNLLKLNVKN